MKDQVLRSKRNSDGAVTTFGGLTRPELMSRIRCSGNATTELKLKNLLRKAKIKGWRRQLNLFGKPDFGWRFERVAVFVDGCFWHGHGCGKNIIPKRNTEIWHEKIARNIKRDKTVTRELKKRGWKVVRIWECSLKQDPESSMRRIKRAIAKKKSQI